MYSKSVVSLLKLSIFSLKLSNHVYCSFFHFILRFNIHQKELVIGVFFLNANEKCMICVFYFNDYIHTYYDLTQFPIKKLHITNECCWFFFCPSTNTVQICVRLRWRRSFFVVLNGVERFFFEQMPISILKPIIIFKLQNDKAWRLHHNHPYFYLYTYFFTYLNNYLQNETGNV